MARRRRTPAKKKHQIREVALHHPGYRVAQEGAKMQKDMASMGQKTSLTRRPRL